MKAKKAQKKVSHNDVQKAVQRFLKSGGFIVQLPDQQMNGDQMVGGEKYQEFDSLANLISS